MIFALMVAFRCLAEDNTDDSTRTLTNLHFGVFDGRNHATRQFPAMIAGLKDLPPAATGGFIPEYHVKKYIEAFYKSFQGPSRRGYCWPGPAENNPAGQIGAGEVVSDEKALSVALTPCPPPQFTPKAFAAHDEEALSAKRNYHTNCGVPTYFFNFLYVPEVAYRSQ